MRTKIVREGSLAWSKITEEDKLIKPSVLSEEQEEAVATYYQLVEKGMLRKLTKRQREIWKLRFFRWTSEEEIAEKLGITERAVLKILDRAGARIKEQIEKYNERKGHEKSA